MDPNANLEELLGLANRSAVGVYRVDCDDHCEDIERMAELVLALDGWLSSGGFLPDRWYPGR